MEIKKRIVYILLVLILIFLLANPMSINYFKGKIKAEALDIYLLKEIELPHSSHIQYKKLNDGIAKYWDGVLFYYNYKGELIWSLHIGAINPLITNNNQSIYIYDQNNNQLTRIEKDGNVVYKVVIEKKVKSFDVNNENLVVLQHNAEGGLLVKSVTLLNEAGKKISEILIREGDILSTLNSKKLNELLIQIIAVKGGSLESHLITYNYNGDVISFNQVDEIILNMFYDKKGSLVLVQENKVTSYIDKEEKWSASIRNVKLVETFNDEILVLYGGNDINSGIIQGRNSLGIIIYKTNGKLIREIKPKEKVKGLDVIEDKVLYYGERSIYVEGFNEEKILEHLYSSDIERAYLFPNNHLVIVTKERLTFTKLQ
ncbi:DUF5711 family protein [Alkaliphilus serpentinus]|uniref:PQQ-like domain-containing protein n=1 Tax=Alkaliphilus serpentinus TaxID=1482731 RepID=A0A833HQR6_9FIRM|nr:DUF5711 family protein [Alkaliphilus serpentinus]KAB3532206.1 hypothetical protein F8153_02835 [Alkaliphilus serpentinus]